MNNNSHLIEFRIWDKRLKEMTYDVQNNTILRGLTLKEGLDYPDSYEVMQFTGLKDKNKKDIYEGDILETEWGVGKFKEIVFWLEEIAGFKQLSITEYNYHKNNWIALANYGKAPGSGNGKVIGNIFENPELIK